MYQHNIVIKGRRPNQEAWSYYNKFPEDNAALNGENPVNRERLLAKLMAKAVSTQSFWLSYEPEGTQIEVVDEGLQREKFKEPKRSPKFSMDEATEASRYAMPSGK